MKSQKEYHFSHGAQVAYEIARAGSTFVNCLSSKGVNMRHRFASEGCHVKVVLFLCTGNYYRSRFAEELFNFWAPAQCPGWMAISRGLAVDLGVNNVGPMAKPAAQALVKHGITFNLQLARMPLQLKTIDLETAHHIVALKKAEHLPLMQERFSSWLSANDYSRIEYWRVDDVDQMEAEQALPLIMDELQRLLRRLAANPAVSFDL